jgi:sugar lactone lactonase YvrE
VSRLRLFVLPLPVVLALAPGALGQSIFTVAGGGSDDGRPATQASLAGPAGVTLDAAGNLFIADSENHRVRRVDAVTGTITTFAGNGAASSSGDGRSAWGASIYSPTGLAFDRGRNLFISDTTARVIRRVDAGTQKISTIAGNGDYGSDGDGGPALQASFLEPWALARDASGDLLISDSGAHRIRKISAATGIITTFAGNGQAASAGDGGPAQSASINEPRGLLVDAAGNVWVAETGGHRIRRIDRQTGIITTAAGTGTEGFSGDGGPATAAQLASPTGLGDDPSGNVYVADRNNYRIRKIASGTGIITTYAGTGDGGASGDGGPAAAATTSPLSLATSPNGTSLYVVEAGNQRVRRISFDTAIIFTVAGNGDYGYTGDLGVATSAGFREPRRAIFDAAGNLYVADSGNYRIRRIDAATRVVTTIAGGGYGEDGGSAVGAYLDFPTDLAFDAAGNLFIAETYGSRIRKVEAGTKTIRTVAGGGEQLGDGGPATSAHLQNPYGIALDASGNLFIADSDQHRIRRVDAATQLITTIAGTGTEGAAGDGGPATAATLSYPDGLAFDAHGNLVFASGNRIRKIDGQTGVITTVAGGGASYGDGGPAALAALDSPSGVFVDAAGSLYFTDPWIGRLRKVDGGTGVISTLAGTEVQGFYGDGGPAAEAGLSIPRGVRVSAAGDVVICDTGANRVRAIRACRTVEAPALGSPAAGASAAGTGVSLSWSAATGAFRYDVYLDTLNPPAKKVAENVTETFFTVANLPAGATLYWAVEAKGDPYCPSVSSARSVVRSFTTPGGCTAPPALDLVAPAAGATEVAPSPTFTWLAASGAGTYDLHLGTSNPPPLVKSGVTGTALDAAAASLPPLLPGTTYYWTVAARAACDKTKSTFSPIRSFRTAGGCASPSAFSLSLPADGATGVAASTTLTWTAAANAAAYDLYLGRTTIPTLYLADLVGTSTTVSGLKPGATYHWRVVARSPCSGGGRQETPLRAFTVSGDCPVPGTPTIAFAPPSVATGQTYVVTWNAAAGLGAGGAYLVERSRSSSFDTILDRQATRATNASFLARTQGTYWHRVRAVAPCGNSVSSAPSAPVAVTVGAGAPNIVFTVPPPATVLGVGERLEDARVRFTLENIGTQTVSAILGKAEISSVPFFTIVDPSGGDAVFVSLPPRTPRAFELRFSGPSNAKTDAYQGIIFVAAQGAGLAVTPYAFVNLKVGSSESATPQILVNGTPSEYAFFDGHPGDDAARPPLVVGIRNPGTLPMELAGEVGPEVWLVPEPGWNSQPIPPGATRTLRLYTKRANAPNGSAFPRYTYFTARTKSGASARLLVQDNDKPATLAGRTAPLPRAAKSYVIPSVVRGNSAIGNTFVSRLLLSNAGNDAVQAELVYTPTDLDGWDATRVRRAVVVVPPNDVVSLTDPLVQLFGLTPPAVGALEVRAAAEKLGFLTVTSTVDAPSANGGTFGFQLPTFERSEGARLGEPQVIPGIVSTSALRTNLILSETTGADGAKVKVTLSDKNGNVVGFERVDMPRYGHHQISGVAARLGAPGGVLTLGRLDVEVESGSGAVASIVTQIDNLTDDAVTWVGRSAPDVASPALVQLMTPAPADGRSRKVLADDPLPVKSVIPSVVNGYRTFPSTPAPWTFQSLIGFTSLSSATATFKLTYNDLASGKTHVATVDVPGRQTVEYTNVLEELFLLPKGQPSQGPVRLESTENGILYCKVFSVTDTGTLGDSFPVIPIPGESLTGASSLVSLYVDGLEQSVTPGVGTRSNLILNEVTGSPAKVVVRLFEAANRTTPVAETTLSLGAFEKRQLSTVFKELGLDSEERRKDRTNVLCVITADETSQGLVSAVVTKIDNKTGDTKNLLLTPAGGVPPGGGVSIGF